MNAVSPNVNTQADFTRALAKAVRRPAIWRIPPKLAYLVLREFVTEELLTDRYMVPQKLLDAGFDWSSPELEPLIRAPGWLGNRSYAEEHRKCSKVSLRL